MQVEPAFWVKCRGSLMPSSSCFVRTASHFAQAVTAGIHWYLRIEQNSAGGLAQKSLPLHIMYGYQNIKNTIRLRRVPQIRWSILSCSQLNSQVLIDSQKCFPRAQVVQFWCIRSSDHPQLSRISEATIARDIH